MTFTFDLVKVPINIWTKRINCACNRQSLRRRLSGPTNKCRHSGPRILFHHNKCTKNRWFLPAPRNLPTAPPCKDYRALYWLNRHCRVRIRGVEVARWLFVTVRRWEGRSNRVWVNLLRRRVRHLRGEINGLVRIVTPQPLTPKTTLNSLWITRP